MYTRLTGLLAALATSVAINAQAPSGGALSHGDFGMAGTNVGAAYTYNGGNITNHFEAHASCQFLTIGNVSLTANARYGSLHTDFATTDLSNPYNPESIGLNGTHAVGAAGVSASGRFRIFGKPLMAFATFTADWGDNRLQRVGGMAVGIIMLRMNRTTIFGVGPALLVNTSSKFPVFPVILYRHQLSKRVAINFSGNMYGVDCSLGRNTLLTAGCDIYLRSFYFHPSTEGLPRHCRFQSTSFRPSLKLRHRLMPGLFAELQGGVILKMSCRVTGATGTHRYIELSQPARPFLQLAASYSL